MIRPLRIFVDVVRVVWGLATGDEQLRRAHRYVHEHGSAAPGALPPCGSSTRTIDLEGAPADLVVCRLLSGHRGPHVDSRRGVTWTTIGEPS